MTAKCVTQGNNFVVQLALTENGAAYADLATADSVTVALATYMGGQIVLSTTAASAQVILDEDAAGNALVGTITWQILSSESAGLEPGQYTLCVQAEASGQKLEWKALALVEITKQCLL